MAVVLEIRCDACDRCGDSARFRPAHLLRRDLRKVGWRQEEAQDYCPECAVKRAQIKAEIRKGKR